MQDKHGGNIWEASKKSGVKPGDIVDFSASINPLGAPAIAKKAALKALELADAYPDPAQTDLRRAIAERHGVKFDEVAAGNGSTELIYLIPRLFSPGRALIIGPAFSEYARSLAAAGWKAESFIARENENFLPDLERLAKKLKARRGCLVWLANPSNPIGSLMKKDGVIRLSKLCRAQGAVLIVDEAFMDFSEDESVVNEAARAGAVIVLRSLTKFYAMAGLRLGYAISNARLIKRLMALVPPWSVNTVAESAAIAALGDKGFRKETLKWLEAERMRLFNGINAIKGLNAFEASANYLTVKSVEGAPDATEIAALLFKKGILIRDLTAWPGLGRRFFRVAVKDKNSNMLLLKALVDVLTKR